MALQPDDLMKKLTDEDLQTVNKLEKEIDADMLKLYDGSGSFSFEITTGINKRVMGELRKRYHKWTIAQQAGCRNDSYLTFIVKRESSSNWYD